MTNHFEAIARILDYLHDEERHFQECNEDERANHIYHQVKILRSWFEHECPPSLQRILTEAIADDWAAAA
jgi:hypothetical protein